jgi:hypothetical protein
MIRRVLTVGLLVMGVGVFTSGCGSDDDDDKPTLYKWSCGCGYACSETESEAAIISGCGDPSCTPTGDTCVCPGGANTCDITSGF